MTIHIVECGVPGCGMSIGLDYDPNMSPQAALWERRWEVRKKTIIIDGKFATQDVPLCRPFHQGYSGPL